MQLKAAPFPVGSPRSHLSNPISALSLAPTLLFQLWNLKLEPFETWGQTIFTLTQARLLLISLPPTTRSFNKSVKQTLEEALKLNITLSCKKFGLCEVQPIHNLAVEIGQDRNCNFFSADDAFFLWPRSFRPCLVGPRHSLSWFLLKAKDEWLIVDKHENEKGNCYQCGWSSSAPPCWLFFQRK